MKLLGADLEICLSNERRVASFGQDDPNRLPAWPTDEQSAEFNRNVIDRLDFLSFRCCTSKCD